MDKFDYPLIQSEIRDLFHRYHLPPNLLDKLAHYRHVSEFGQLVEGAVVRCLAVDDHAPIKLNPSCIVCDVLTNNDGMFLKCKNFGSGRYFYVNMSTHLIFQKLTQPELVVMKLLLENPA